MSGEPVRPVLLEEPQARQKWVNPDGSLSAYGHRYQHSVFMRLGAYNDDVWRALGVGFTGLTQINQVNQRVSDVEAAAAAVQGAVAGLRGDPRLEAGPEALALAITALVQAVARSSGETNKRLGDLDRLVGSLGARLTKATQNFQMQSDRMADDLQASQQFQVSFIQRSSSDRIELADEIEVISSEFEERVRAAVSASSPVEFDSLSGVFSLSASAGDKLLYSTAADTWAEATITTAARNFMTAEDNSEQRAIIGCGTLAAQNTINNGDWSGADLEIANGGTGASTASAARTALGLAIGSDVAAYFAPQSGWSAATGTANRTTFDTATVTLPQLAERVKALVDDLISSETIGA